ncbi:MAG: prepilin-type N-terminal cleavage/methylation domain-containing protein [Planctomycetes bacterium]|nr:prepilin-type N-terminal cleavage/methylation domain-containing protein [Planctomycetota bacterium]
MRHIINQAKHRNHEKAFSLIETMIAAVVLMIVMGSIMMFRYYTVVNRCG